MTPRRQKNLRQPRSRERTAWKMASLSTWNLSRWADREPKQNQERAAEFQGCSCRDTPLLKRQPKWVISSPGLFWPEQ
jgi:hypothetical protein